MIWQAIPSGDGSGTLTVYGDVQYGRVPLWIFEAMRDGRVSPLAVALYGWLMLRYSHMQRGIFPSHKTLAGEIGISDRHVKTMLGQLRGIGAVDWREQRIQGRQSTNSYVIAWLGPHQFGPWSSQTTPTGGTTVPTAGGTTVPTAGGTTVPTNKKEVETDRGREDQTPCAPPADAADPRGAGTLPLDLDEHPAAPPKRQTSLEAQRADALARTWWEALPDKPAGKRAYPNARGVILGAVKAGWSDPDIAAALARCGMAVTLDALNYHRQRSNRPAAARPSTTDQRVSSALDLALQLHAEELANGAANGATLMIGAGS